MCRPSLRSNRERGSRPCLSPGRGESAAQAPQRGGLRGLGRRGPPPELCRYRVLAPGRGRSVAGRPGGAARAGLGAGQGASPRARPPRDRPTRNRRHARDEPRHPSEVRGRRCEARRWPAHRRRRGTQRARLLRAAELVASPPRVSAAATRRDQEAWGAPSVCRARLRRRLELQVLRRHPLRRDEPALVPGWPRARGSGGHGRPPHPGGRPPPPTRVADRNRLPQRPRVHIEPAPGLRGGCRDVPAAGAPRGIPVRDQADLHLRAARRETGSRSSRPGASLRPGSLRPLAQAGLLRRAKPAGVGTDEPRLGLPGSARSVGLHERTDRASRPDAGGRLARRRDLAPGQRVEHPTAASGEPRIRTGDSHMGEACTRRGCSSADPGQAARDARGIDDAPDAVARRRRRASGPPPQVGEARRRGRARVAA